MYKSLLLAGLFCLSVSLCLHAQSPGAVVTVNGSVVEHTLSRLTFSGDNVILHFSDGTTDQSADMDEVTIDLSALTSIGRVNAYASSQLVGNRLELGGMAVGERITLYDAAGRKLMQTVASASTTTLPLDGLQRGTYIVRAGSNIIKFQKK